MFDIGFQELMLLAITALLVMGPERLPDFARNCGLWIGRLKRFINHVKREVEQELKLKDQHRYDDKLSDMDDLMREAPDRQPDYERPADSKESNTSEDG